VEKMGETPTEYTSHRKRSEFGTMIRSRSYFIEAVAGSEEQSGGFGRQAFRQGTGERFDPEGTQEP
jgi:hypothetical protein